MNFFFRGETDGAPVGSQTGRSVGYNVLQSINMAYWRTLSHYPSCLLTTRELTSMQDTAYIIILGH